MLRSAYDIQPVYLYIEDLDDEVTKDFYLRHSLNYNIIKVKIGNITLENIYKKQDFEQILKVYGRFLLTSHNPNYISRAILIQDVKNIKQYSWRGK